MISPKIYRDAALRIFEGKHTFCCGAIYTKFNDPYASTLGVYLAVSEFEKYFKPLKSKGPFYFGSAIVKENQLHRITALLLMAEIAKDLK